MTFLKRNLKKIPFIGNQLISIIWSVKKLFLNVNSSEEYWENVYKSGGNSGQGSYNRLAEFKAEIINDFLVKQNIKHCIEFGCGDGNQLELIKYPSYTGLDVSSTIIQINIKKFEKDKTKSFFLYDSLSFKDNHHVFNADLTLSLDVIFHLVDDTIYNKYMTDLFNSSTKYVIVYSSNYDTKKEHHEKDHFFTKWVEMNRSDWKLIQHIPNKYPFDKQNPDLTSKADFYFFEKGI